MEEHMRAKNEPATRLRSGPNLSDGNLAGVAVCVLGMVLIGLGASTQPATSEQNAGLAQCESIISLEKRLLMERWAKEGACDRPIRVRFTDRFLGYTCTSEGGGTDLCHAFVPDPTSRAFDTAQVFRCVDVALAEADDGSVTVSRMREWAATPKQCDWDPASGILAMEVDFDNAQVCVGASCMAVDRLTSIGKVRLQRLVASAFREFGLMAQAKGTHAISPVRAKAD
jgi:hypothetical protein